MPPQIKPFQEIGKNLNTLWNGGNQELLPMVFQDSAMEDEEKSKRLTSSLYI